MRARRTALTLIAAATLAAGCGTKTVTVTTPRTVQGVAEIPADQIRTPPETARIPEGAEPTTLARRQPTKLLGALALGGIQVSNYGVNLVGGFEGFSSCPYWDAYGRVWTRGYGETDFGGNFGGRCISRTFGLYNLRRLLNVSYLWPVRRIGGHFNQCQIDAMASASYNLGPGILTGHASSLRAHNAYFLLGYVHAGGVTLAGLVRRRRAEVSLFYSHRCGRPPAPETRAHKQKRLHLAQTRIIVLRRALGHHGCRQAIKHHHAGRRCARWKREGDQLHRQVRALHREGIR